MVLIEMTTEAVETRKRLRENREVKLRKRRGLNENGEKDPDALKKLVFRSYKPHDTELEKNVVPEVVPPDRYIDETIQVDSTEVIAGEQLDLSNLTAKKPDVDLKRKIELKLRYLQSKTDKCIMRIVIENYRKNLNENPDN